jgi:hypothetical protein
MWTAAKRAASGLPTLSSALKVAGGLFACDVLYTNCVQRNSSTWAGDLNKKTWSSGFTMNERKTSRTYETKIVSDPETGYRYPVGVIRSKRLDGDAKKSNSGFKPVEFAAPGWENAGAWEPLPLPVQ